MATIINADTSDGLKLTSDTSGEIQFQSGGVTKAGVNATGLTGNGSQLTGLVASTLDDYEEGTFTPTISFGGASVGVVYNQQLGFYTKVGDIVHCTIRMVLTNKGTSTGGSAIGGLPFVNKNTAGNYPTGSINYRNVSFADFPQFYININGTELVLQEATNAGVVTNIANTNWANNSNTMFSVTYRV